MAIKKKNTCTRLVQVTVLMPEGYDYIQSGSERSCKYIQNGKLFIYIDDRIYNVLGQEIK